MITYRFLSAEAIPVHARDYTGYDMDMKPGYTLWGTATGIIPYHRKWWIISPSGEVFYLDQGSYENSRVALQERVRWARQIGALPADTVDVSNFTFDLAKLDVDVSADTVDVSNFTFDLEKLDT